MQSKNVVQSTSAWGAVLLIIPAVMQIFGSPLSSEEIAQVNAAGASLDHIAMQAMTIIGTIQMIIGRLNARQPLHFLPGNTFRIEQDGSKTYLGKGSFGVPEDVLAKMFGQKKEP